MKFTLSPEQQSFFLKKRHLEIEEIWNAQEIDLLKQTSEELLATRLGVVKEKLATQQTLALFREGRDLALTDKKFKKQLFPKRLIQLATALFDAPFLRVGFSQYIFTGSDQKSPFGAPCVTLKEICSMSEIVGGVLLCVTKGENDVVQGNKFCPIPEKEGNAIFLNKELIFSTEQFFSNPGQCLQLILFCPRKTLYLLQQKDPLTHLLKKSGYAFGDPLKDATHPPLN